MRRLTKQRLAIFSIGMVFSLVFAGVLYAHWTDTLEVEGIVDTGEIRAEWVTVQGCESQNPDFQVNSHGGGDHTATRPNYPGQPGWASNPVADTSTGGTDFLVWETNKNVAYFEGPVFSSDRKTVTLTWKNTYPSFFDDCEMEFNNFGSIPIAVPYLVIEAGPDTVLASDMFAEDGDVWVDWTGQTPPNVQIDPEQAARIVGSLKMHVEQPAEQGRVGEGAYTVSVTVCYHNWNEPTSVEDDICDLYEAGDGKIVIPEP